MNGLVFSEDLKRAINAVSQDVAADLEGDDGSSPEIVAEVTIDANRLAMWGFTVEDVEVGVLCDIYGYPAVLAEAAKHVATW